MIFIGDIASPTKHHTEQLRLVFEENSNIFKNKKVIINLEGLLSDRSPHLDNKPILFNHPYLPNILKDVIDPVFCMANNHILDLPSNYDNTVGSLNNLNIKFCGVGKSREEANEPLLFFEGGKRIVLFNACWDFLLYNQKNPSLGVYVNELAELQLLRQVKKYRMLFPESLIVLYFHWNLDLEKLPFPMYRQFAKDLIDSGANVVVGTHSHCVQGGEKYNDGYIVYGLGNFFMPHNIYLGGKLSYPDFSRIQLAFEWEFENKEPVCHWFQYNNNGKQLIEHIGSEEFLLSIRMREYSKFKGMKSKQYKSYFKKERRKRFFIPVYSDYNKTFKNKVFTFLLKFRAIFARILARYNIIKWQN